MIDRSHLSRAAALAALAAITLAGCSSSSNKAAAKPAAQGKAPVKRFEQARRDPPIAADTRFAAGQLAESNGNFPEAAEQYQKALRRDPKHASAMFRLGVVLAEMKKFHDAVDVWKQYVKVTDHSPQAYANLGFCYELGGRIDEAEAAYQKGIGKDPSNVACRVNYGLMLIRKGRVGEGKIQLGAVLKPAEVHYNLASVYEMIGRTEQAKAEYRKALTIDPQFADAATRLNELETGSTAPPPPAAGLSKTE